MGRRSRRDPARYDVIPQTIDPLWTPKEICDFSSKWTLDDDLGSRLVILAGAYPVPIRIISGNRSWQEQNSLPEGIDPSISDHTKCPSRAADLDPAVSSLDPLVKIEIGVACIAAGLRWGGGAPVNDMGIPIKNEWRHVSLF